MSETFLHAGDTALVVEFGRDIDRSVSARVMQLDAALRLARIEGIVETTPTFRSLMIHYNPTVVGWRKLAAAIEAVREMCDFEGRASDETVARSWRIPVCYEHAYAPDLSSVAERVGRTPEDVINLHCARSYYAYMIAGFPGYPHMGDIHEALRLPRLPEPRTSVPPGSVAIANRLTAVYPVASPGGWHLIGRTPIPLFDPLRARPALISAGDTVVFERVDRKEFERLLVETECDDYEIDCLMIEKGEA